MMSIAREFFFKKVPNARPKEDLKVTQLDSTQITNYKGEARLFWYGHSAFLLQMNEKKYFVRSYFWRSCSSSSVIRRRRFNKNMPLEIEKLPKIDAVVISHDHYDHLDYESIEKLKNIVSHFFVPLGVGVHLKSWGIEENRITELDWWNGVDYVGLKLVCTPSQHFSGRKFNTNGSIL